MFERFSDTARRVVVVAHEEARRYHHNEVDIEHILLALTRDDNSGAAKVLDSLSISLQRVREEMQEEMTPGMGASPSHIPFTVDARSALEFGVREASELGQKNIGTEHILLGISFKSESNAAKALSRLGGDFARVREQVLQLFPGGQANESGELEVRLETQDHARGSVILDRFGRNLTQVARSHRLDPAIGRDEEVERLMQVLSRRTRNNAVLIGEPGIDKSKVVDGAASAIAYGGAPEMLRDMQLYVLDWDTLIAQETAEFERTMKAIFDEIDGRGDIILFIDEIHTLLVDEKDINMSRLFQRLMSGMAKGSLKVVGATTLDDYRMYVEKHPALHQIVEQVHVEELPVAAAVEYLKAERERLEMYYRVTITDDACLAAAELAHRYIRNQFLPNSAISLIDDACTRRRAVTRSPEMKLLDDQINDAKSQKVAAIDAQDFERAALLRDSEQRLITKYTEIERRWKAASLNSVLLVDKEEIIAAGTSISGVPREKILLALSHVLDVGKSSPNDLATSGSSYTLLGDLPVKDIQDDLLAIKEKAQAIAEIIKLSRKSSPFVIAIDGSWGTGKSTLLHQMDICLSELSDIGIVRYNAWTSQGKNALEGLIKSVLLELDPNFLRRWLNKLAKRKHMLKVGQLILWTVARFFGAARLIDEIWRQLHVDAQGRNELRSVLFDMLSEWRARGADSAEGKTLIVFIDDLDRCSDDVIVQLCEAVKLYLDAPGLIFVIGCDLSVLRRSVSAHNGGNEARVYLEKIIQVVHRLQPPSEELLRNLIRGYAERSGTTELIDDNVKEILSERTERNPRRIKRVINSFVFESHLNPSWNSPSLGNDQLIRAVILQHLYPSFYEELVADRSGGDPIGDFLDYADVKNRAADPPASNDAWWSTSSRFFRKHGISPPPRSKAGGGILSTALSELEPDLPADYPRLARDQAFVALVRGVGDYQARSTLRSHLRNEPLAQSVFADDRTAGATA